MSAIALAGCKEDELDLSKISKKVEFDHELAAPLVHGRFNLSKFIEQSEDSIIVVENDTVKLMIREDSLFNIKATDVVEIPEQTQAPYVIISDYTLDIFDSVGIGELWSPIFLINDTIFEMQLENSMRLDSMIMEGGSLELRVTNNFNQHIDLLLRSVSVFTPEDNYLVTTVPVDGFGTVVTQSVPLNDHTIVTRKAPDGSTEMVLTFIPQVYNDGVNTTINAGDNLQIEFRFTGEDEFEIIYGFAGFNEYTYDTTFALDWEGIEGLSGTFNVTNPKIKFNYLQSFGFYLDADVSVLGYHTSQSNVVINPTAFRIPEMEDPEDPPVDDVLEISSANVSNIDELIAFPIPDSVQFSATVFTNPGADSVTATNFVLQDSRIDVDLEVEIPLEFRADLTYRDTMKLDDFGDLENTTINYANLHYKFENYFPVGFNASLVLYDSINMQNIDEIYLTEDPNEYFLKPAPVDVNGIVIRSQVEEYQDFIGLTTSQTDHLIKQATHIIILARLQTTNITSVKILEDSSLEFIFGLEAEGTYSGYMTDN